MSIDYVGTDGLQLLKNPQAIPLLDKEVARLIFKKLICQFALDEHLIATLFSTLLSQFQFIRDFHSQVNT